MIETGWNEARIPVVYESGPVARLTVGTRRAGSGLLAIDEDRQVRKLEGATTMTVRLSQYGGAQAFRFQASGFDRAADRLPTLCGIR